MAQVGLNGVTGAWQEFAPLAGFERNWMFLEELRHFIVVLHGQAEPACTLQDGVQALQLALAARQEQLVHFD